MKPRHLLLIVSCLALIGAGLLYYDSRPTGGIRLNDAEQIAVGKTVYARECAACHGVNLEGQMRNWRQRLPDGRLPAPPHDATGHTWHHPDLVLFEITKHGRLMAGRNTVGSNMPAFKDRLSDAEIWAVLSFIKSTWPSQIQHRHDAMNERYRASR